jgi:hypothetical protein
VHCHLSVFLRELVRGYDVIKAAAAEQEGVAVILMLRMLLARYRVLLVLLASIGAVSCLHTVLAIDAKLTELALLE